MLQSSFWAGALPRALRMALARARPVGSLPSIFFSISTASRPRLILSEPALRPSSSASQSCCVVIMATAASSAVLPLAPAGLSAALHRVDRPASAESITQDQPPVMSTILLVSFHAARPAGPLASNILASMGIHAAQSPAENTAVPSFFTGSRGSNA